MQFFKLHFRSFLNSLGLEIRRKQPNFISRCSMAGCLTQAAKNGLVVKTVIDVGAASGTPELYKVFPDAQHLLLEPLDEFVPYLEKWTQILKSAKYISAVASSQTGKAKINVHPDLFGSSLYLENEDSDVNGVERIVPAVTLDQVCLENSLPTPYLIKIDTQGSELDVLKGAVSILEDTEFIIIEATFFNFFEGAPSMFDTIQFLKERGFVVYDIFDISYRPLDKAMSQVDIAFTKEDGVLRKIHAYASKEQRKNQNELILSDF